jgi:hypothetical protein
MMKDFFGSLFLFDIITSMSIGVLKLIGNVLYFIGALILVPATAVIVASLNTLMLAGPTVLLLPVLGATLAGTGKWLTRIAQRLEKDATSRLMTNTLKNK